MASRHRIGQVKVPAPESDHIRLGRLGEALVVRFVAAKGWQIMDRNWRCRWGEIDLVALDGSELVIGEVKTRVGRRRGSPSPLEAITPAKLRRLYRLGGLWLSDRGGRPERVRIDAFGVTIDPSDGQYQIHHARGV